MKKRILVVEDDRNVCSALEARLRAYGYQVACAHDATCGISMAVKKKPDLIILDISMPAGGGFFVAERVRAIEEIADTPIIFITASRDPQLRQKAATLGAAAYLEKPYDAHVLMTTIDEMEVLNEN